MRALLLGSILLLAGCVSPMQDAASLLSTDGLRVVDPDGAPIPYATVTLMAGEAVVARLSTDAAGALVAPPSTFDAAIVSAPGFATLRVTSFDGTIVLAPSATVDALDPTPGLRMLSPFAFERYVLGPEPLCGVRNTCGLSEPVIEAAADGVLYASSVCCIGGSPPVWVSRDAGATWEHLETPGIREAVGIEGDLAVDAAGNVYFTDILLGAMWITSWDAEGNWRHTTPVPFEPLVDRPWVRAGAEDVVYFLYNTGGTTNFHASTDGGRTFSPIPLARFPAPLGSLGQGPEPEHLWATVGGKLYESTDGGATWSAGEDIPLPDGRDDDASYGFVNPAVDASGRVIVAYDLGNTDEGFDVIAAIREVDGSWSVHEVSPPNGTHVHAWPEAGPDGGFVVAWYGVDAQATDPESVSADAPWHVYLAASHDAGRTWQTTRADPEALMTGPFARRLLDFLQLDLDDAGAAHVVYAHNRDGTRAEMTNYVRTTVGLGLPQMPVQAGEADGRNTLSSYVGAALGLS